MTDLATGRYSTFAPAQGVPIQTSIGRPKFPLRYDLTEKVPDLMPFGLLGADLSADEFTAAYRERLDKAGVDSLAATFAAISARHGGARLVLLCFEDVHAGQLCHRRIFADHWLERTGQRVDEVEPAPPAQLQLTDAADAAEGQ
jgi:hypothetical protein